MLALIDIKSISLREISFFDDINQFWNGKVLNSDVIVPMGVYVYQIEFKNPEGKYFQRKGHITLIK